MFVVMEQELLHWNEILPGLAVGKKIEIAADKVSGAYSGINQMKTIEPKKKFGIRTHPVSLKKFLIRIK